MKRFSWRGAVAVALLASCTGLVSAQVTDVPPIPLGGASRLTFAVGLSDTNARNFGETFNAQLTALPPAEGVYQTELDGWIYGVTVNFPEVDTVRDATTNLATSVSSAGGIRVTVPRASGISLGGSITLSNWEINAVTHQLSADITGTRDLPSQSRVAVFTLGEAEVVGGLTSYSLWLTPAGADAFEQAGGLIGQGLFAMEALQQGSFGTISVDVAMVPEPSSYALALAGGVMMLAAARRQARRQAEVQPA